MLSWQYELCVFSIQCVAEAAEDIWDHYGYDLGTDYSGIFKALSHVNYNVRVAAAEALAAALDESPDTIQVYLASIFCLLEMYWKFSLTILEW